MVWRGNCSRAGARHGSATPRIKTSSRAPSAAGAARARSLRVNRPRFFDAAPRIGVVYDLFGNAKTALKFSVSKYSTQLSALSVLGFNPISSTGDTRTWLDCNLVPGTSTCSSTILPTNGDNIAQDNEIGPSNNPLFGSAVAAVPDPNLKREYAWDWSASAQHEVAPGVSVLVGWYTTRSYNAQATINSAVTLSSY